MRVTNNFRKLYRWVCLNAYTKPQCILSHLLYPSRTAIHKSYFPDKVSKSFFRIWVEQLFQILKFGTSNEFYFPYGLDVKDRKEMDEYLHYLPFMRMRDERNIKPHSATAVLRDKLLFGMFTSYYGINSAINVGIILSDDFFDLQNKKHTSLKSFFQNQTEANWFIKPIDGECGKGIVHLQIYENKYIINGEEVDVHSLVEMFKNESYIIQNTVNQNKIMKELHPQSLNTIRLVTIRNPKTKKPEVFPSILRIGTGDSIVDNTSQGGLAVGIEMDSGRLKEYGFYKPYFGTKVNKHPDSEIIFSKFCIPFFEECKRQAIFLHSMLPDIHSIGWDIAIGKNGPIFIEGNDNWEINGPQICHGGLKKLFISYCK